MVLKPIQHIDAIKILKEIPTEGSSPLQIFADDFQIYFAKTCNKKVPRFELINEIIGGYFAQCWSLKVPNFALIKIDQQVVDNFENENGHLSMRYQLESFFNEKFFASQNIETDLEIDQFIKGLTSKNDFRKFQNPLDIIKIGVLDLWLGNKDRKPSNPNILLKGSASEISFHPIDHTASFAYTTDYLAVNDVFMGIEGNNSILYAPFVRAIANFASPNFRSELKDEIFEGMNIAIDNIEFIFDQVPRDWGFSKRSKQHLIKFFSDTERNKRIARSYIDYI